MFADKLAVPITTHLEEAELIRSEVEHVKPDMFELPPEVRREYSANGLSQIKLIRLDRRISQDLFSFPTLPMDKGSYSTDQWALLSGRDGAD